MKIRILLAVSLAVSGVLELVGQSVSSQVLDAYFTTLTRQHQVIRQISAELQQISSNLHQDYHHLLDLQDQDGTLGWTYFFKNLERAGATTHLITQCRESRRLKTLLQRYHNYQLVDAFSQTTIDTSRAMRRLQFFDVREGQRVAEIGFGYGYNLHLLGVAFEKLEIYANELALHHLKQMEQKVEAEYPAGRRDNFHFIAGAPRSTKLEGVQLDLIIMENVFHHIGAPETFIQSMEASLGPEGEIVIIEEFTDANNSGNGHCPDLMSRAEFLRLFSGQGFYISREEHLSGQYKTMLRLTRQPESPLQE